MSEEEFMAIAVDYLNTTINPEGAKPVLATKAVIVMQALADDDDMHLYSWTSENTFSWDALGMVETIKSDIVNSY